MKYSAVFVTAFVLLLFVSEITSRWSPDATAGGLIGKKYIVAEFPYMASLQHGGHLCGAAVLSENWLITAAKCTEHFYEGEYTIVVGARDITPDQDTASKQIVEVAEFVNNPQYDSLTGANGISLIRLASNLTFTRSVQPIKIGSPAVDGARGELVGWGYDGISARSSNHLQYLELPVFGHSECATTLSDFLRGLEILFDPASNICTPVFEGATACEGDQGSPLVQNGRLVGVASHVLGSCVKNPGPVIYTTPALYLDWIRRYVPSA